MFVGVCDDNRQDREELIQCIKKQDSPVPVQIFSFSTIHELEQCKQKPDVLFWDIEIGEENSIEYFQRSGILFSIPVIVLVSAYSYYVTNAFTVPVAQFILKPIQPNLFEKVFAECCQQYMRLQQYCEVTLRNQEKRIVSLRHIIFIKSEYRQLIYTDTLNRQYIGTEGLKTVLNRLQQFGFCQIHKSYLVNLMFVSSITEKGVAIQLENKSLSLPAGKKYLNTARQIYLKYLAVKGAN